MASGMTIRGWAHSDTGNVRQQNQDSWLVDTDHGVFAVADGVGGNEGGDVASKVLVQMVRSEAETIWELARAGDSGEDARHRERVLDTLHSQVEKANGEVFRIGRGKMSTTADVLAVSGNAGYIAHVGDSRIYLIREGQVTRLTDDHTFAEKLRAQRRAHGSDSEEGLDRFQHMLTRSVGNQPRVDVDTIFVDVQPGDQFILCSDGVSDSLAEERMRDILNAWEGPDRPKKLTEAAAEEGSTDNLTAVVVEASAGFADAEDTKDKLDTLGKLEFLEQVDLFRGLQPQELLRVLPIIYRREFEAGETIVQEGNAPDSLYMVVEGSVELVSEGSDIGTLGPGEHFGELALFGGALRSADVIAAEDVLVLEMTSSDFREMTEVQDPEIGNTLLRNLLTRASDRLRRTTSKMVELQKKVEESE
jgi:serine/threonine protein phosphatase PrpC